MMKLENEKVNREKYYFVGYSPELGKYVLAIVVTWVAWYERYYEITEEEYNSFGSPELDKLADELLNKQIFSDRFLFSERKEENSISIRAQKLREYVYGSNSGL